MFERIGPEFQCSTGQGGGGIPMFECRELEFQCLKGNGRNSNVNKNRARIPMLIKIGPE